MDCERAEVLLRAFVDGEISPAAGEEYERHLAACPDCSALVLEARGISKAIRLGTPPLRGLLRSLEPDVIFARARALELEEDFSLVAALKRVAAAAAAILVLATGLLLYSSSAEKAQPPAYANKAMLSKIAMSADWAAIDDDEWNLTNLLRG